MAKTRATPLAESGVRINGGLLVVLALLGALAPFATDLYLPAFPRMTDELSASPTAVQLTLTSFLIGTALGQLIFGPASDRWGRFWPLVSGAVVCVAASAFAATAGTIEILVVARFAQGLGGAAGMVIGRAIITDLARGASAARAFSLLVIVGGAAPTLAPLIGGLLADPIGWRGILWVIFGLAALMLISIVLVVRETHGSEFRSASFLPAGGSGLLSRTFVGNTLVFALSFGVLMAYISASPFVYQVMMGLTPPGYGLLFGINSIGLIAASAVSARLVERVGPAAILRIGMASLVLSTLALLLFVLAGLPAWSFAFPLFTSVASLGLVLGNATGIALSSIPRARGAGSAILGAGQFALAAAASPLVNLAGEASAIPLAIVMLALAAAAAGALALSRNGRERSEATGQVQS